MEIDYFLFFYLYLSPEQGGSVSSAGLLFSSQQRELAFSSDASRKRCLPWLTKEAARIQQSEQASVVFFF